MKADYIQGTKMKYESLDEQEKVELPFNSTVIQAIKRNDPGIKGGFYQSNSVTNMRCAALFPVHYLHDFVVSHQCDNTARHLLSNNAT